MTGPTEAGTGSPEAGTGSPVGYVVAGKGWKTESVSHLSHGRVRAATCTPGGAPAEPGIEFGEADWELPSISSTSSGSSSYGRPPPGLATVGGATTTSLRILRYDKKSKLTTKAATDCYAFLPD